MGKHSGRTGGTIVPRPIHRGSHRGKGCFGFVVSGISIAIFAILAIFF